MTKAPKGGSPARTEQQINARRLAPIRKRHGDLCWLCGRPMRFEGIANRGKAATIEHLEPRKLGGGNDRENLRLCHSGCNRMLKDHPRERKEKIRAKIARAARRT